MNNNHLAFNQIVCPALGNARICTTLFMIHAGRIVVLCLLALTCVPCIGFAQDRIPTSDNGSSLQTFQDWSVRCIDRPSAVNSKQPTSIQVMCEAGQTVTIDQNGQKVEILKLAISPAKDKAGKSDWALVALFPLDVLLNSDFGLSTGKDKSTLYRFRNCNHLGCFGVAPLDKAILSRLKKSSEGAFYFRLLTGKAVKVVFSLKGFGQAFEVLRSRTKTEEISSTSHSGTKK